MTELLAGLEQAFAAAGMKFTVVPAERGPEVAREIREAGERGTIAPPVYREYLGHLADHRPLPGARSLIVIAIHSPRLKVIFHLDGGDSLEALIPPTYVSSEAEAECLDILTRVLAPAGCKVERARLPVKRLAVRSALAEQGRNDICYVQGFGSHARLEAFYTDCDLVAEFLARPRVPRTTPAHNRWLAPVRMGACGACHHCRVKCPTKCIPSDESSIAQDRCLTYLNENEGEWPSWLPPDAHNALIGCLKCQDLCPGNRDIGLIAERVGEFDAEETRIILQDLSPEELPPSLQEKLKALDLLELSPLLGRNLRALLQAKQICRQAAEK
jgi:epoxyqueuosine reductase